MPTRRLPISRGELLEVPPTCFFSSARSALEIRFVALRAAVLGIAKGGGAWKSVVLVAPVPRAGRLTVRQTRVEGLPLWQSDGTIGEGELPPNLLFDKLIWQGRPGRNRGTAIARCGERSMFARTAGMVRREIDEKNRNGFVAGLTGGLILWVPSSLRLREMLAPRC